MKNFLFYLFDTLILCPLAFAWSSVYRVRRYAYRFNFISSHRFKVPIISVGNISFGGTGKTPITMWLAEYFESQQKKVMVLMRGYRGGLEGDYGIIQGASQVGPNPLLFGDEALLIARRLHHGSVVVGKNRAQNLKHYFTQEFPDIVILDDGHQHLKIQRNLNLVLFDALMEFKLYDAPPRGYLREGLTSLRDADFALIGRADIAGTQRIEELKAFLRQYLRPNVPIACFRYSAFGLFNSKFEKMLDITELQGKKVLAVTGIASPEAFFSSLVDAGAEIIQKMVFPDHHHFSLTQVKNILDQAEEADAYVITTEKDIVKLRRMVDSPRILFLQINVVFTEGEDTLKQKLHSL